MRTIFTAAAFAPQALPPSLKLRRTAVALAEAGRRASPELEMKTAERRRDAAQPAGFRVKFPAFLGVLRSDRGEL
jgi:hypothetical protein